MKKRLILILTLGLSLTGCLGKKVAPEEKKTPPPPKIKESVESFESVEEKPKEKEVVKKSDPYQDIYDEIEGKKFYFNSDASYYGSIYFYRDGYFDGSDVSGNGGHVNISFFNGKFNIVKKVDDLTYKIKLARLAYDEPKQKEQLFADENGMHTLVHYVNQSVLDKKSINPDIQDPEYYYLRLPQTKISSLSEQQLRGLGLSYDTASEDGNLGVFAITSKDAGVYAELKE